MLRTLPLLRFASQAESRQTATPTFWAVAVFLFSLIFCLMPTGFVRSEAERPRPFANSSGNFMGGMERPVDQKIKPESLGFGVSY